MSDAPDILVLDASVAVKWHLRDEEYAEESVAVLRDFAQGKVELIAPSHIKYEVASAITVATLGRVPRLTQRQGQEAVEEFLDLGIVTVDDDALVLAAYPLVHDHAIALYDALYVALAQRLGRSLITADQSLHRRIAHLTGVTWINDYPSPST